MRILALAGLAAFVTGPAVAQELPNPTLEFAFEEIVTLGQATAPGDTARGGRLIIPITGGTFKGPEIEGTVVPGGWDWQLRRADGCTEIEADYFLRTDDGVTINVVNKGVIVPARRSACGVRITRCSRRRAASMNGCRAGLFGTLEQAPPSAGRRSRFAALSGALDWMSRRKLSNLPQEDPIRRGYCGRWYEACSVAAWRRGSAVLRRQGDASGQRLRKRLQWPTGAGCGRGVGVGSRTTADAAQATPEAQAIVDAFEPARRAGEPATQGANCVPTG